MVRSCALILALLLFSVSTSAQSGNPEYYFLPEPLLKDTATVIPDTANPFAPGSRVLYARHLVNDQRYREAAAEYLDIYDIYRDTAALYQYASLQLFLGNHAELLTALAPFSDEAAVHWKSLVGTVALESRKPAQQALSSELNTDLTWADNILRLRKRRLKKWIRTERFSDTARFSRFSNTINYRLSLHRKKPWLAGGMSTLIPGTGKMYSGHWIDGVFSLATISAYGTVAAAGFSEHGSSSVAGWIYGFCAAGFYAGNIYGSVREARHYNREHRNFTAARLTQILSGHLKQISPRIHHFYSVSQNLSVPETDSAGYYHRLEQLRPLSVQEKLEYGRISMLRGDYDKAKILYHSINQHTDTVLAQALIGEFQAQLNTEDYQALILLADRPLAISDTALIRRIRFYRFLANWQNGSYELALNDIDYLLKDHTAARQEVIRLVRKMQRGNKGKTAAMAMSAVLPGSGQLYSGDYGNAANSFLLNAAFGAMTVYTASRYDWSFSAVVVGSWWLRYYLGGIRMAGNAAVYRNRKKYYQTRNDIIRIISNPAVY